MAVLEIPAECTFAQQPTNPKTSFRISITFANSLSFIIQSVRVTTSKGNTQNLFKYFRCFLRVYFAREKAVFWSRAECDCKIFAMSSLLVPVASCFKASISAMVSLWTVGSSIMCLFVLVSTDTSSSTPSALVLGVAPSSRSPGVSL